MARRPLVQAQDPKGRKPSKERKQALEGLAARFAAFRPAREVLKVVRAVPTRFVQFDHAVKVGGFPLERFNLLHGPSNEGKTLFSLGLIESFLAAGHFAYHLDEERTTPITWVRQLLGAHADSPRYFAARSDSYEAAIASVRQFCNTLAAARKAKEIEEQTSAIILVDSLRKLVPKDLIAEILKLEASEKVAKNVTAGRDRRAQIQAKMNAAWMDELVPLLEMCGATFLAIGREMVDPDADMWAKMRGDDYKLGGGGAIFFDSSLVSRAERVGWVEKKTTVVGPDGKKRTERDVYGERHRVTIRKTKVGGKEDRVAVAYFHSSNGKLTPFGFDRGRDVLELAQRFGIVKSVGKRAGLAWGNRRWENDHRAAVKLAADPDMLAELETLVRARFADNKPVELDGDTGEVE